MSILSRVALPLLLGVVWLLLTGGDPASWVVGIPFIVLAIFAMPRGASTALGQLPLKLALLPQFLGYFCVESVRGGVDVSRRVLAAKPNVEPGFFDYPISLQSFFARHLFINTISLLPGTLSADWRDDDNARIHTLDRSPQSIAAVRQLEQRIGRLFGEQL